MSFLAGNKLALAVAIVLGVGLILFGVTQYIQSAAEDSIKLEILEEQDKKREKIREGISQGVGNSSPDDDASDSLQYLRGRD